MPIKIPREDKRILIEQLREEMTKEGQEDPGPFVVEHLFDFVVKQTAPYIYNMAVQDARMVTEEKCDSLIEDLYSLERPLLRREEE
ncbi:DUF2164 family protein [Aureibacillus halotolerans]|uniref:Uncharacterized protein (DUF2164 family) n=1 Tax=Aureibacillus halotolerans TaxID=1508390 RepID=A0A4V3D5Z9_9BACI|nr:DUF2164 family protein [Aureibacillus halotolerans]TDQ42007.1 uncharacterized protein (DUF2164 family) [Aureibacillus halotolerans]